MMSAKKFTLDAMQEISEECSPIKSRLPLVAFSHDITSNNCRHAMLTTSERVSQLYQNKQLEINYMNKDGRRVMHEGFHSTAMLHKHYHSYRSSESDYFEALSATHNIHYHSKNNNIDHLFTWSFQCDNATFDAILLNEKNMLEDFTKEHLIRNKKRLASALDQENSLAFNISASYNESDDKPLYINISKKLPLTLTTKQCACLNLLLKGLTAKQIANNLNISFRTVQHHIDAIKDNNNLGSTKEILLHVKAI